MQRLAVLLFMPFIYAEYLSTNVDGGDSGLWDLSVGPPDAGDPVFDTEEFQNAIGLDDSISFQPASLMAVDDDSSAMFSESDPYIISMDQCSSSADDILPSKRLRTRGGAFCTNTDDESARVNQNPFLAGLDASERIIDPENRRQCAYKYETVCCEGPFFLPDRALDCHPCEFLISTRSAPIVYQVFAFSVYPRFTSHHRKPSQLSKMLFSNGANNISFHSRVDHPDERTCWSPWTYFCCSALMVSGRLGMNDDLRF